MDRENLICKIGCDIQSMDCGHGGSDMGINNHTVVSHFIYTYNYKVVKLDIIRIGKVPG